MRDAHRCPQKKPPGNDTPEKIEGIALGGVGMKRKVRTIQDERAARVLEYISVGGGGGDTKIKLTKQSVHAGGPWSWYLQSTVRE